jgi:N-acetylglucosaminyldiphosphoundecaprenol N-acetyl-beta-D-mannosaminyltransferase
MLLGIPIDNLNMQEMLDRVEELIRSGRENGKSHQAATVNVDFIVKATRDPELHDLLVHADLATADGMPLIWSSQLFGTPIKERVAGSDLVPLLAERAAEKQFSIYFYGSGPGIAARAAEILKEKYPGLIVAGVKSPPFSKTLTVDPEVVDEIRAANPDILLVGLGNPKQEKWIGMYRKHLKVPFMIGVGGTMDMITGNLKRAPVWMQRVGLEWLFRMLQEPGRLWRRYTTDFFVFGSLVWKQWSAQGFRPAQNVLPESRSDELKSDLILAKEGSTPSRLTRE